MENFTTENELEDIICRMGQNIENRSQLTTLKNEVDRYFNEECSSSENDVLNESLFSSLLINPAAQFARKDRGYPNENMAMQSPIVSRKRRGKNCVYENVELQNKFDDENQNLEAEGLINEAWQSIHRAFEACRNASEIVEKISNSDDQDEIGDGEIDEEEDVAESELVEISSGPSPSIEMSKPVHHINDPSVRPVRSPKPGKVAYKFDPVTRYHLYKAEWDRHPTPGELRRLSLRWKVREFMLRHDVPRLTSNPGGIVEHSKEWSPRPYMQ